jgi:hypothetical protein
MIKEAENIVGSFEAAPDEETTSLLNSSPRGEFLRFLVNAAVVGTAAMAGVSCKRDMPSVTDGMKPIKSSAPSEPSFRMDPKYRVDIDESSSVSLPDCEVSSDQPYDFELPEGIDLPREQFIAVMNATVERIKLTVGPRLIENFKRTGGRGREWKVTVVNSLRSMFDLVADAHPSFKPLVSGAFVEFSKSTDAMNSCSSFLNKFLNPVGYHFFLWAGSEWESDLFEISSVDLATIDFGEGENKKHRVPLLHLDSAILRDDLALSALGACSSDSKSALMFDNLRYISIRNIRTIMSDIPGMDGDVDFDKLGEDHDMGNNIHESSHIAIARMFPTVPTSSLSELFDFEINVSLAGSDSSLPFTNMPAANFHELCANGIQLSQTDFDVPYGILNFIATSSELILSEGYQLLAVLLPLVILDAAPDSKLKQEVTKRYFDGILDGNHSFNKMDFAKLVTDESFTIEHTRRVGEIFFRIGFDLLEKVSKGDLKTKTVTLPSESFKL